MTINNNISARTPTLKMNLAVLETENVGHQKTCERLEAEINQLKAKKKAAKIDMDENKTAEDKKRLMEAKEKLTEKTDMMRVASLILKDSGIKSRMIKLYVPYINNYINKYLSDMDLFVSFEMNETFAETIKSRHFDIFTYNSFSEGEKLRIDLAILFTWRQIAKKRNSVTTNLLIMDEIFDRSLDDDGMEELMKLLAALTADTNTFIISQRGSQLADRFDRVIHFEKAKNYNKMTVAA
jgi:hypothetical protein